MALLISFLIILVMTLCSKFLRTLAFGRSDSVALELCICSFLYRLLAAVASLSGRRPAPFRFRYPRGFFFREELMRCLVLLLFAFVVAAVHKYNKDLCMAQVDQLVRERRTVLRLCGRFDETDMLQSPEEAILDNTGLLARASIDVWYSQFMDKLFYRLLRRADSGDVKRSFRKKKTLVRWAFAELLNSISLGVHPENGPELEALDDKAFNIPNKRQIVSMAVFDAMELLSLLVALKII